MITAKNVASYFIRKSSALDENNDLTNLKLQKMLYYAQAEYIKCHDEKRLFADPISAWAYGPVVENVYDWLKGCGSFTISSFDVDLASDIMDEKIRIFLDGIWNKYSKYSAFFLVEQTHMKNSPWDVTINNGHGLNQVIPVDLIKAKAVLL